MALVLGFGELSLVSRAGFYPNLKSPPCAEWSDTNIGRAGGLC